MRLVKSPVDNQDVEKSYIGGHKGLHEGHEEKNPEDFTVLLP